MDEKSSVRVRAVRSVLTYAIAVALAVYCSQSWRMFHEIQPWISIVSSAVLTAIGFMCTKMDRIIADSGLRMTHRWMVPDASVPSGATIILLGFMAPIVTSATTSVLWGNRNDPSQGSMLGLIFSPLWGVQIASVSFVAWLALKGVTKSLWYMGKKLHASRNPPEPYP